MAWINSFSWGSSLSLRNRVFSAAYYSDHAQDQAMDQERPSGVNAVEDFVLTMNAASALRFPGFAAQNLQRDA